ncbi:MAG: hypothetical protein V8R75_02980 [Oscillospiraceae bacterium]
MSDKTVLNQLLDQINVDTIWERASHICDTWPDRLPGTPAPRSMRNMLRIITGRPAWMT